jgi:hypothetical protein
MRERRRREGTTLWPLRDSDNDTSGGWKREKERGGDSEDRRKGVRAQREGERDRFAFVSLHVRIKECIVQTR